MAHENFLHRLRLLLPSLLAAISLVPNCLAEAEAEAFVGTIGQQVLLPTTQVALNCTFVDNTTISFFGLLRLVLRTVIVLDVQY